MNITLATCVLSCYKVIWQSEVMISNNKLVVVAGEERMGALSGYSATVTSLTGA